MQQHSLIQRSRAGTCIKAPMYRLTGLICDSNCMTMSCFLAYTWLIRRRPLNIHHELSKKGNQATLALGLEPARPPLVVRLGGWQWLQLMPCINRASPWHLCLSVSNWLLLLPPFVFKSSWPTSLLLFFELFNNLSSSKKLSTIVVLFRRYMSEILVLAYLPFISIPINSTVLTFGLALLPLHFPPHGPDSPALSSCSKALFSAFPCASPPARPIFEPFQSPFFSLLKLLFTHLDSNVTRRSSVRYFARGIFCAGIKLSLLHGESTIVLLLAPIYLHIWGDGLSTTTKSTYPLNSSSTYSGFTPSP
jgi:hypothetical protein